MNKKRYFYCDECNKKCKGARGLGIHKARHKVKNQGIVPESWQIVLMVVCIACGVVAIGMYALSV